MNSIMGRVPDIAAPTPKPAKPASVMGVSITLSRPNLSSKSLDTCASMDEFSNNFCKNTGNANNVYLVRSLILSNFLSHQEDFGISLHFLRYGFPQRISDSKLQKLQQKKVKKNY